MALLNVFVNNLLPILLLSGAGFALGRTLKLDSRPLGRVIFYILSPALVLDILTSSKLAVERILLMMGYAVLESRWLSPNVRRLKKRDSNVCTYV